MSPSNEVLEYQPRLHIAVDKLDVVDGPGAALMSKGKNAYSPEQGVRVRFTVMTPASTCQTTVKATVYDAFNISTPETEFDLEPVLTDEWRFTCQIGGWLFYGTYNSTTRSGWLDAITWDPDDPTDGRNWD